MEEDLARRSIDFFVRCSAEHIGETKNIVFYGGEPLINFSTIESAVKYARKLEESNSFNGKIQFTMFTNCSLVTKSIAKFLSKNNITIIASVRLYEKELGRKNPFLIICNAESKKDVERLKKLGANKVVAPPELMAKRVSAMAIRPDMENVLEEFLYKKDTPIDMEEIYIEDNSWFIDQEIKDAHLRDKLKVSIVGITTSNGTFIQTPKGNTKVSKGCKLLVIGDQIGISKAKKLVNDSIKPKNLELLDKKDKIYV